MWEWKWNPINSVGVEWKVFCFGWNGIQTTLKELNANKRGQRVQNILRKHYTKMRTKKAEASFEVVKNLYQDEILENDICKTIRNKETQNVKFWFTLQWHYKLANSPTFKQKLGFFRHFQALAIGLNISQFQSYKNSRCTAETFLWLKKCEICVFNFHPKFQQHLCKQAIEKLSFSYYFFTISLLVFS